MGRRRSVVVSGKRTRAEGMASAWERLHSGVAVRTGTVMFPSDPAANPLCDRGQTISLSALNVLICKICWLVAMVVKMDHASESPRGIVKTHRLLGPPHSFGFGFGRSEAGPENSHF